MRPEILKKGDRITVVAPSGRVNQDDIKRATRIFHDWGLQVDVADHVFDGHYQFSGTDKSRLEDLQSAIDDNDCRAIVCARGGYGLTRIIDKVNIDPLFTHPKWIVGYSDITALHFLLHKNGVESVHSIMPSQMGKSGSEISVNSLHSLLMKGITVPVESKHKMNRQGRAEGILIGGNISLIENMIGTSTGVDFSGKILFIEDVGEYLYRLDRMLVHLRRAEVFSDLSGLVVGTFSDMKDGSVEFGKAPYEMVLEQCIDYDFPIMFGAKVGHTLENIALPVSRKFSLEVDSDTGKLTES